MGAAAGKATVRGAVRRAFVRAALPWSGTHIPGHAAATRMIQGGSSLKLVADVLRHRSIDTTASYAKVDLPNLSRVAGWAGVCPGTHESAGKRKSGRSRKGTPYVPRLLCGAAYAASRIRFGLAEKFKSLLVRRERKRAIFALAHKLLKTVFVLIDRGDYYGGASVDYEAMSVERNVPRWIKMLRKYRYITA